MYARTSRYLDSLTLRVNHETQSGVSTGGDRLAYSELVVGAVKICGTTVKGAHAFLQQ